MEQQVEELSRVVRYIDKRVIRHILENVCFGNVKLARDALRSLRYDERQEIKKNLEENTTQEVELTPLQQDRCRQFQSVTSCNQEVAVEFLKKADWVLEPAINRFFESGGITESSKKEKRTAEGSGGSEGVGTSPDEEEEEVKKKKEEEKEKEKALQVEYEGLYDVKNKEYLILESVMYDISVTDYAAEKTCIRRFINKKNDPVELVYVFPMLDDTSSVFSVEVDVVDLETKEISKHKAEIKKNRTSSEEYDDRISRGDLVVLLEKREKQNQLAQLVLGNIHPKHEVIVYVKSIEELTYEDYEDDVMFEEEEDEGEDDDEEDEEDEGGILTPKSRGVEKKMMMKFRIPSLFPLLEEKEKTEQQEEQQQQQQPTGGDSEVLGSNEDQIEQTVKSALAIKNVSLRCSVNLFGGEIVSINSPGVLLQRERKRSANWSVTTKREIAMTKDIILEILVKSFPPASCLIQAIPEGIVENARAAGMLSFIPRNNKFPEGVVEDEQAILTELIIVVDCSGSMSGSRIRYAREAMRCFVQSLDPEDKLKLNIVRFGSHYQQLWSQPKELTDDNFHEVLDYVNLTKSNLAQTDILTPLLRVLRTDVTPGYSRQIFLLTDGEDKKTLRITQRVKESAKSTRIFTLGIGKEINVFLIKETSRVSHGKFGFIKEANQIREKVMEQLLYAFQPSVSDLELKWPDQEKFGKVESVLRDGLSSWVYLNERKILYFFLEKVPEKEGEEEFVTINFLFGSAMTRNTVKVPIRVIPPDSQMVPPLLIGRLSAMKRIDELQKYGKSKQKDIAQIEKLGLGFSLLSSETSFILKAKQDNPIETEVEMINIPTIPYIEKWHFPRNPTINIPRNNNMYRGGGAGGVVKRGRGFMYGGRTGVSRDEYQELISHAGHYSDGVMSRYNPDQRGMGIGSEFERRAKEIANQREGGEEDKKEEEKPKEEEVAEQKKEEDKKKPEEDPQKKKGISFQEVVMIMNEEKKRKEMEERMRREEGRHHRNLHKQNQQGLSWGGSGGGGSDQIVSSEAKKASFQEHAQAQYEYRQNIQRGRSHDRAFDDTWRWSKGDESLVHLHRGSRNTRSIGGGGGYDRHERRPVPSENVKNKKKDSSSEEVEGEVVDGDDDGEIPHDLPALEPADDPTDDEDEEPDIYEYRPEGDRMIAGQHHVGSPPGIRRGRGRGAGGNYNEMEDIHRIFDDDTDEDFHDNDGNEINDYYWNNQSDYYGMGIEHPRRHREHVQRYHRNRPTFFDQDSRKRRRRTGSGNGGGRAKHNNNNKNTSSSSTTTSTAQKSSSNNDIKNKKEKYKTVREKMDTIEGGTMNKILYTQGLSGIWVFDEFFVAELLQLPPGLVIEMNPLFKNTDRKRMRLRNQQEQQEKEQQQKEEGGNKDEKKKDEEEEVVDEEEKRTLSLWISALTLVTLQRYYKNSMIIWKLIAKKTERTLLRNKIDLKKIIRTAEEFIRKHRKR